jgi:hypothetical protein
MAIDAEVARALDEVERLRGERERMKRDLADKVAETLELSGVGGMWAKLRGSYERQLADAEREVAEIRGALEITDAAVREMEARLAEVRAEAQARAEREAEAPRPRPAIAPLPADAVAERLLAVEQLEAVLKPLRRLAPRLSERARKVAEAHRYQRWRHRRGSLAATLSMTRSDATLEGMRREWEEQLEQALALAAQLELPLRLDPIDGMAHASAGWGYDAFAEQIEDLAIEIDGMLERLRDTHRELRQAGPDSGGDRRAQLQALVGRWERLFELGRQLDRACVPGVKTSALLGLMAAWNNEARVAAELADSLGLPLRPPVNAGGNLARFVAELRASLPGLHQRVEALRRLF